jgi:signal transduction histidine kinase
MNVFSVYDKKGNFTGTKTISRDITILKQAEGKLKKSHEQLCALTFRLSNVEEAERKRLSQELHDLVGQNLTALGINLHTLPSKLSYKTREKLSEWFSDSNRLLGETVNSIRDVMAELRPSVLDDYGLLAAIRWYSEQFSHRSEATIEINGEEIEPRLSSEVETLLFRIVQESLTNVLKHAKANKVNITLEKIDGMIRLTVGDNGVGFDYTDTRKKGEHLGWGLIMMEERVSVLGGQLSVESELGKGTQIIVEVER